METTLGKLFRLYSEPHRHYHTFRHIAEMLQVGSKYSLSEEQVIAIYYHDAIYDPRSTENEENSALLAEADLKAQGYSEDRIKLVKQIIVDTKSHKPNTLPSALVLDLDMMILAERPSRYRLYIRGIASEYEWLGDHFYELRKVFLEKTLKTDKIFYTPEFNHLELMARQNLEQELKCLQNRSLI